ncbi:hypothetical protein DPX39_100167800 [Trypanosoma brucei equiperdum]|uniref:Uncharacterized protein n=1 Tax=Trypanosoma brucei equiperdum TaxID=630700 RepID=A0A3L6KWK9_9TRYP|nr:hypothetical protein DPX39_100167800 [Trypanosoma brucei equiperdum]
MCSRHPLRQRPLPHISAVPAGPFRQRRSTHAPEDPDVSSFRGATCGDGSVKKEASGANAHPSRLLSGCAAHLCTQDEPSKGVTCRFCTTIGLGLFGGHGSARGHSRVHMEPTLRLWSLHGGGFYGLWSPPLDAPATWRTSLNTVTAGPGGVSLTE